MKKRDLKRVNMNLPKILVDKVDEYAKKTGITFTAAVTFLLYDVFKFMEEFDK